MTGGGAYDAIVVGGGHNGLVCAAYVAGAGLRTLVVERRARAGGGLATVELAPGVRSPGYAHTVGRLDPGIARDLRLREHGLRLVQSRVRAFAPALHGPSVTLWGDVERTERELGDRSGGGYARLDARVRAFGRVLAPFMRLTPPDPSQPTPGLAVDALRIALRYRGLEEADARALLRVLPMPVADLLEDHLPDDSLRAAVAYRGMLYSSLGPRAAGSAQVLLADAAGNDGGLAGQSVFALGGPGALADALCAAARTAGAEVRTNAEVVAIVRRDDRAAGVVLASGEELRSTVVVSGLDPKRTLLELLEPEVLGPQLGWRVGNLRQRGVTAKVDLALAGPPPFRGAEGSEGAERLRGRIVIAPSVEWLDRAADAAKYGRVSERPLLEVTIPTLVDPSLADGPVGARGVRHVMSILVQSAPYSLREGSWDLEGERLADRVVSTLEDFAPGIGALVAARRVVTPRDLERELGTIGGHPFHGEPALDQWFAWRPMLGFASYRMPLDGLYLAGAGAHPGGGITGLPGRNAARAVIGDHRGRSSRAERPRSRPVFRGSAFITG